MANSFKNKKNSNEGKLNIAAYFVMMIAAAFLLISIVNLKSFIDIQSDMNSAEGFDIFAQIMIFSSVGMSQLVISFVCFFLFIVFLIIYFRWKKNG